MTSTKRFNEQIGVNPQMLTLQQKVDGLGDLSGRVAKIEGSMGQISSDLHILMEKELRRVSNLPTLEFQAELPRVSAMVRLASEGGNQIDAPLADQLRQKMVAVDVKSPDYWNVAAILVNASSQAAMLLPPSMRLGPGSKIVNVTIRGGVWDLDSQAFESVWFINCLIRYRGGALHIHNVVFENCRFIFQIPIRLIPPPTGQTLTKTLLAANISDVKFD